MNQTSIKLKKIEISDLIHIHRWKQDRELARLIGAQLSNPTLEQVHLWFEKNSTDDLQKIFGIYLNDSECIGLARLMFIDYKSSITELGIYIGERTNRGKGYGKRAIGLLLDCALRELGLNRVFLKVSTENLEAIKTYEKCGFKKEGILRQHFRFEEQFNDMLVMGILRGENLKMKDGL